ncbi:retrotransposon protein [Tanacetum coccineum]|uniref:Retrotransposon protein n=1 Tax=Tanacetum coccineum TaxID=301880 RepID=A0ABQ5JAC7_9ASTR
MAESAKRHEENSNIIKEIRASTNAAIRNQGESIKTLEIQIVQMSKFLKEKESEIRRMGCSPYAVSGSQHRSMFSETVPFPRRLQNYYCDDWREAQDVKILEAYDHTLPQKEKDTGSFTLPCFIHNVCFDKALVDLGASVSVMPFSTYTNLGLGILSHTRLTIELADRTIKQPRGIAENMLVRIGKFIFPIDFIILDIPDDDDVPLILGFIIIDAEDVTRDVALDMPFFMKYVSCQMEPYGDLAIRKIDDMCAGDVVDFRTWPGISLETTTMSTMDLDGETFLTGKDIKVKKSKNEQKPTRNEETSTREILEANIESRIKTVVEKRQESKEKDKGNDHYTL